MAPKIWDVLSESKRIIHAQPRHYLTLSLFFLPASFLSILYQLIIKHLQQQQPPTNYTTIISLSLPYIILSSIVTYCAFIAITYSVFNAYFNRPIKLKEAIKSISTSFFPLLATNIVIVVIFFFINFLSLLLIGLVWFLFIYLGHFDTKPYLYLLVVIFYMLIMLVSLFLVIYLHINLSLVKIIVVVESRWGFEPLKISWKLMKGMKRLVLSIILLFGLLEGILVWISRYSQLLIFVISPILAIISVYNIAAYTVFYIYCKDKHEELTEVDKIKDEANLSLIPL